MATARPNPAGGCNYLCCSGGPPAGIYRLVEAAIPDVEMVHGRPTVHPDGSLEFAGTPPTIPGYRQEGLRLYPAWPPCRMRMLRVQVIEGVKEKLERVRAGIASRRLLPERAEGRAWA